mmetsp:Transcript_71769/g.149876  ORF Transcript_71769/g.149876 Transcript_71769/m.149876 type:complete len:624 (-) Transcript_71769:225-2096(-)
MNTSEESCHSPEPDRCSDEPESSHQSPNCGTEIVLTDWQTNKRRRITNAVEDGSSVKVHSNQHPFDLIKGLAGLYESQSLCDVTLRVDGEDFKAHRVVLAAASDFLRVLLVGGWKESKEEVVNLKGIDGKAFRAILKYLYSGELVATGVEELLNILVASEHVGIHTVRDLCVQRLQQLLDLPNALQMWVFAQQVQCIELEAVAAEVVWGQFTQVAATSTDFLELDVNQLEELLGSDQLAVDSEAEVLNALLRWAGHAAEARAEALISLLCKVRFAMLPSWTLESVGSDKLMQAAMQKSESVRMLVESAIKYQAAAPDSDERKQLERCLETQPRKPRVGRVLLALGGRPAWTRVEKLELKTMRWNEVASMGQKRMRHGSATVGGFVYVVGGKDQEGHALASMERYDAQRDAWEAVSPMLTARTGLGVAALAGRLYVVGGRHDSGYRLRTVECYNVQTDSWSERAPMTVARGAVKVGALNGHLYAIGGRSDQGEAVASVERYDPLEDAWNPVAPMNTPRVGAGVEVLDGLLYAIGGKDEKGNKLRSVERYDVRSDSWSSVASMVTKRWGAGVASLESRLYVIGGMNGAERGSLPTVEVYDPATDTWTELPSGPRLARGSCTFAAA